MKKILSYPLSVIFYLVFGLVLVIFHGLQFIAHRGFGYRAHKISVDWLNFFIMRCLNLLGTRIYFDNPYQLKKGIPHIVVANHQSMYDIPPLIWYLRKIHPKFISKKELGKGIPSVSYNLRHGGSVLIDRKNSESAVEAIKAFGQYLSKNKRSGVIFPEGTRSRDGQLKRFSENGLRTLVESCPDATVVPVSIDNSWKLQQHGMFPLPVGINIRFKVHQPIKASSLKFDELFEHCKNKIENEISSFN
ncbi:lysophospholipid acyltransferase family protein [Flavobacteriaceae bacterium 14752]|uniref:lysophospholipid acyltransferase family protein n=1 Tax=Mesohalobacter salilacus TaxID=2491711 RepID=UPI000F644942|nr:1-acyl-sn-glycerol-3-phosphate acyltransferase [Flavobacteriaceae bacterium 14752]